MKADLFTIKSKCLPFWRLARMDRPIGWLLLLWPTLWALFIAAQGIPSIKNLVIFVLGVILMRSAGCVINDFADRKIDGRVERTKARPIVSGEVTSKQALYFFVGLVILAGMLVLATNDLTFKLAFGGLALASVYPFMKRYTHLPQVVLGAAFAWSIPMAWAAQSNGFSSVTWLLYIAVVLWTVVYDTFYAMVDREDDLKIGVKSTAILFGEHDRLITALFQAVVVYILYTVGEQAGLGWAYYVSLVGVAALFVYQQILIRDYDRGLCFNAFLNNNVVGAVVFLGLVFDLVVL